MDNSVFVIENDRRIEVDAFNKRNLEDLDRNYFVEKDDMTEELIAEKEAIAKKIHQSIDKCPISEIPKLHNLCTTEKEYRRQILAFELKYYKGKPQSMSLTEFRDAAQSILDRYQSKAGGNLIEDLDWTFYTSEDNVEGRVVMENELLIENSIPRCDAEENETNYYLEAIVEQLRQLSDDIKIDLRFNDDHDITWIWIWCTHKKMGSTVPKIGL